MCKTELNITPDLNSAELYWERKPDWAKHDQSVEDLAFTMGVINFFHPKCMLEIGVSAGLTSGALLVSANKYNNARLDAVDIAATVYYDSTKKVGEVVESLSYELQAKYHLHLNKTAVDVPEIGSLYDLVFIDGNHAHPWATFDLLCILPTLEKYSVVILHDIHYFCTHSQGGFCLYESVQLQKDKNKNIGCFQIKDNIELLLDDIYSSLTMNWQDTLPIESIVKAKFILAEYFGNSIAERFNTLLMTKFEEYARNFPIYKYMRQQQWGREMETRKVAAKYRDLLTSTSSM